MLKKSKNVQKIFKRTIVTGRATAEGTRRYCERNSVPLTTVLNPDDIEISSLGFGGFRFNNSFHRTAIMKGFRLGINVVDTAPHFTNGKSETIIGEAIKYATHKKDISRDELFVITKGGYVHKQLKEKISSYPFNLTQVSPGNDHCIDPEFLSLSLSESLNNLQLDCVDLFMVNNPEIPFQKKTRQFGSLKDDIKYCFERLEQESIEGRIGFYGITSNSLTKPNELSSILNPDCLLEIAESVAGKNHKFRGLEFPLNVYEHSGFTTPLPSSSSLMNLAAERGLWQFTQRTFMAITPKNQIQRLSDFPLPDNDNESDYLVKLFQQCIQLEEELMEAPSELIDKLRPEIRNRAQELASNTDLLRNIFVLQQFVEKFVLPSVDLVSQMTSEHGDRWAEWSENYNDSMQELCDEVIFLARAHANLSLEEISDIITSTCPKLKTSPFISQQLLRVNFGTPASCVLVGMTNDNYVDELLSACAHGEINPEDANRIFSLPTFN